MFKSDLLGQAASFEDSTLEICGACPRLCRHACPVAEAEARESTSPHALVVLSDLLKKRRIEAEAAREFVYHCSHCGACQTACLHRNDVARVLTLSRHRLLVERAAPAEIKELSGRFGVAGNPQGASLAPALSEVARAASRPVVREAKDVYLPGCTTLERAPEAAVDFLRALSLLGVFGVELTEASDSCCGLPLYWAGDLEGFRQHARRIAAQFQGVERLIVHDPACAHGMMARYREVGVELGPEIWSVPRFLDHVHGAESAPASTARRDAETLKWHGRVVHADVCCSDRGLDLVEVGRRLIHRATGVKVVDLSELLGRERDCCGAGGLLPLTAPATARAMGEEWLRAFRHSGLDTLAVPSPRCVAHLRSIDPTANIVDLASLLARV